MEAISKTKFRVGAKFFYSGENKYWIKGVTYGTFAPSDNSDYPSPERVSEDFRLMREAGINTVRIYTAPPKYLLDEAFNQGLHVIVGLAWMQHVCFLDDPQMARQIREQVRREVRACAGHPAILAYAIGNEIPPQIVRWNGAKATERFLKQLYTDVKREAPGTLVTYVNFPPTDYLDLSFLDFVCFNVFLHEGEDFRAYLSKLQNVAGNRPLVLTELGMDSIRQGVEGQAEFIDWQLREAYLGGVAGACVFSWTDDWYRGGNQIEDWAFGLVDAQRRPKPAYAAVKARLTQIPFEAASQKAWPKVSVVICAYNSASTIEDNLESLTRLNYPNYEVIVVNDGSKDATPEIAARYPFKLISVPNGGLSAARNLGLHAATGEIVAYTDSDTRVDPDWLSYLVQPFLTTDAVGVGGPNVVPHDDEWIAQCVARSPGGPAHVLISDTVAEHIPGCNMAFRKWALEEIGGFDPTYVKAGDDVDVCWRLHDRGWHLAFSPSALVWHHHRNSVEAYWRQQVGYGEGESFLEHRHQEKFNERGQTRWQGRIYSSLPAHRSIFRSVIYHGRWGAEAFPSIYQGGINSWTCLPQMIEWQVATACSILGVLVTPWILALTVFMLSTTLWRCLAHAWATPIEEQNFDYPVSTWKWRLTIAWLHYIQPWARLRGRIKGYFSETNVNAEGRRLIESAQRLTLGDSLKLLFHRLDVTCWDTHYTSIDQFLVSMKAVGDTAFRPVKCDDGWQQEYDLKLCAGHLYAIKVKVTAEDHGGLKRLFRVRFNLHKSWRLLLAMASIAVLVGCVAQLFALPWAAFAALAFLLSLAFVMLAVSKRGGQVVEAINLVGAELELFSLSNRKQTDEAKRASRANLGRTSKEKEPIFEE